MNTSMSVREDGANARFLGDTGGSGVSPSAPSGDNQKASDAPTDDGQKASRPETYTVRIDRWHAHYDDRTCGDCLALDWHEFEADAGPWPPLHTHCRCGREIGVRFETRTRSGGTDGARP